MDKDQFALFMDHIRIATAARLASSESAWMTEVPVDHHAADFDEVVHSKKSRGEPGSKLRKLFDAYADAMAAWRAAREQVAESPQLDDDAYLL